ncbi:hypothetical protein [Pseudomonas chlororaphis]|uniref:hypothetical protein n=1 Tax=Pseudomonas chlororaphis TaxID=587753 RepID=UPI001B33F698|nr:hypothetical protein [Pseudomonas chlororaphis]
MSTLIELTESLRLADIAINAIGGFLGSALLLWLAMGRQGIRTLRSRLARPTVQLQDRKTPENIFTGIELGAPAEWIKEQLGPPRIGGATDSPTPWSLSHLTRATLF